MSFRDDLEAARERRDALERDVAAARSRRAGDKTRLDELRRALAARDAGWKSSFFLNTSSVGLRAVRVAVVLTFATSLIYNLTSTGDSPTVPSPPQWTVEPHAALARHLGARGVQPEILSFDADELNPSGEVLLREGAQLRAGTYFSVGPRCEVVELSTGREVVERRTGTPCGDAAPRAVRCSPAEIRQHAVERGLRLGATAGVHYQNGEWQVRGGGQVLTLPDDCDGQWWPPHG